MSMPMPVGVSGPGALSQRTDVQPMSVPTGMPYGDASAMHQSEQAVPMAGTPPIPSSAPDAVAQAAAPGPTPPPTLDQPSQLPDEPVTAGAASGPGPGPEAITPGQQMPGMPGGGPVSQAIARAAAIDTSGTLAALLAIAQQKGL